MKFSSGTFLAGPVPHDAAGRRRDIAECEQILRSLGPEPDGDAAAESGVALWRLGEDLLGEQRLAAAADRFSEAAEILGRFEQLREIELQARFRQGTVLAELGRNEEAMPALETVVRAITPDIPEDGALGTVAASAVSLWLSVLEKVGDSARAEAAAREISERFGSGASGQQRLLTATALAWHGRIALSTGRHELALSIFDDVIRRVSPERDPEFRTLDIEVSVKRARALEEGGRSVEALAAYHDCLSAPKRSTVLSRAELVAAEDSAAEARRSIKRLKRAGHRL